MNHPKLADNYTCTGCMACADTCPKSALSSKWNDEGHLSVACDASKCVLCHQCERVCPVVSSFNYSTEGNSEFFAAWNKDDNQRRNSSSGGAFSAIATFILKKGGYVVGASNEGVCDIKHIIIHNLSELCKIQGSKYTQSNTTGIYKKTLNLLKDGELVLFSGTGCQVAGLLSYVKHKKYTGKLITIDLVCGGVPSHLLIKKFIENEPYKVKKIISFRSKEHGWKSIGFSYNLLVEDEMGRIHNYSEVRNLITDGFSRDMTERYSCYDCHFNGSHRISDFTIGDLWGDTDYPEQHKQGLSLIIAHNEQSKILLSSMNRFLQIEPTDKVAAIHNNPRIVNGYNVKSHLYERKHLSWMFEHLSYKTLKHVYANDISRYSPWMLYKIWRKIRIEVLKFNHKVKRTIICRKSDNSFGGGVFLRIKQSFFAVFLRIFLNNCLEAWIEAKYMASYGMLSNPLKLKTHIAIKVHALEKGMSIGNTRYGFGKKKAFEVLHDLQHYLSLGGDIEFANECCSIIKRYISFNELGHADMSDVKEKFHDFCNESKISIMPYGGIYDLNHSEIKAKQNLPFDVFSQCRFSCRDFGKSPINKEDVQKALQLCERTPSACNRQSVRLHIYFDKDKKDRICKLQGGCKGFSDDFQAAILVCEDLTGYSSAETNLPYVDGGLYAMNLLYSLNFYDIAAIPLTMGHRAHYNINVLKQMNIPSNEVPVLLIGIGSYKDKWRVAQSHRKDWREYTTIN